MLTYRERGRREDEHRPAPWVRTRLRSARTAAALTAVLAFVTVLTVTALPRATDRGANSALAAFAQDRGVKATSLHLTARPRPDTPAAELDSARDRLVGQIIRDLPLTRDGEHHGTRALTDRAMLNDGYDRPGGMAPQLHLLYLQGLAGHATLTDGAWPGPAAPGEPLPIAVSRRAADTIGLRVGDTVDSGPAARARIVGLYRADDPHDRYWQELPCPERACLKTLDGGGVRWETAGFAAGDSRPALLAWGGGGEDFWRLPVDPHALRADRLAALRSGAASYLAGPGAVLAAEVTGRPDLTLGTLLPEVLAEATARHRATAPLAAIGPAGVAGVAAVVLCLAAALAADRRTAELRLLQARGGSRAGILLRLLGESAVTVLPAAGAATALALVLLPTPRWTAAVLAAVAATLLAVLALPVRAAALLSRPPGTGGPPDGARASGRRRAVGELLVLAVTGAAVAEVRRRGAAPPASGPDPLLVTAPLLVALSGGLLLARIQPPVVGRLAALARRGRGPIAFLGLARSARDSSGRHRPAVLPALALLLAVTTAGFGATLLDTVDGARLRAARTAVGGDAAVLVPQDAPLPEAFVTAADALPGVRASTGVRIERQTYLLGAGRLAVQVTLVVVEPRAYAEIARTVGAGAFDPALLNDAAVLADPAVLVDAAPSDTAPSTVAPSDAPVPALVSPGLAAQLTPGPQRLRTPGGELLATVVGTTPATPALPEAVREFVVVPVGAAAARLPELARPDNWFAVGDIDGDRLRPLFAARGLADASGLAGLLREEAREVSEEPGGIPDGYLVRTARETAAALAADPLQHSTVRLFRSAAVAGVAFALLAVLLTVLRASPDRAAVLARLRTMGLRPREGLALIVAETVPQTLAAVAGGAVVAAGAVALLGPAFDLSLLVGAPVGDRLVPRVLPVLLPTAGVALLVCAAVVLEAAVSGRRQIATELRAGDRR
ncbi:hypothetical protein [Kitasatospora purpeofusca]|uniref:hypothetical protein n=1 Tax=Kitasatospora purpeofusca TaxID=67352 RepID=UPI00225A99CC|nr:hypothetical protein [Kitasatospora purpeofusca]MCX4755461.1 hypothetical protein [Kitasatospora purpeofusca]WSR36668.1 hypothetical protein OG715_40325 [Kitasatospora purpeofusca]